MIVMTEIQEEEVNVEIIPINDSKLKIMLDESDMKELHICEDADCARGETRLAIRTILERAKTQIGFNTEGSEIFVQLYTSKGGGCELFITKSNALPFASLNNEGKSDKKPQRREGPHKKKTQEESCAITPKAETLPTQRRSTIGKMIFSFESLRDMCDVCKILKEKKSGVESRAYRGADDNYYLVIENANMSAYCRLDSLTFILEYGRRERADHISTYLSECGKAICLENAIETLSDF